MQINQHVRGLVLVLLSWHHVTLQHGRCATSNDTDRFDGVPELGNSVHFALLGFLILGGHWEGAH